MSDAATPKEQLTAYERWELPSFGTTGMEDAAQPASFARQNKNKTDIVLPTAVQLEEIQRQAHDEGYQTGYAEGTQRIAALLNAMEQALQQALKTNPEILLNVIREAISSLPHFNQGAHLVLHPDDATMVRASMGEQLSHSGWKIFEDALIARGGARVETAHSQIDATLANRWQRIVAAIGQDSSWIQE